MGAVGAVAVRSTGGVAPSDPPRVPTLVPSGRRGGGVPGRPVGF
ncbi:hypothetical protein EV14_0354 [Prochlorococcus sp. MIT 0703]|nr:hypothetical protein EV14_0354 [Prochlorococcus sp. MIT 0703]